MFITIEGIDGCGKTSQSILVNDLLKKNGKKTFLTSEPRCSGFIPWAENVLDIIINQDIDVKTQLILLNAIRYEHLQKIILPKIKDGNIVICDRFIHSTIAYQHYGFGGDLDLILDLHNKLHNNIMPDVVYFLDLDVQEAKKRISSRGDESRFDKMSNEIFNKMRNGFLTMKNDSFVIIDASKSKDEIANIIFNDILQRLK
ncbi:dTMP kinase [Candidatus Deianiraea vastatrix]|uniref:Thymidylate kinase n=1 Tax=Candidatus Deianiraea vastatrix TaxID=2163644 RepID=A0A5B8XDH6_9RICK|nr:dTMP kinase [Candidatus Deianiraea vastatrix]QED22935.1 Thymidylate kinase [Candidatus Deianiraea vastatrix]